MRWFYYTGTGSTTLATPLKDNVVNELFRDGEKYRKVDITPIGKTFNYDPATGDFIFDDTLPPIDVDETVDISVKYDSIISPQTSYVFGTSGIGYITNLTKFNTFLPVWRTWRFRPPWKDIEISPGVFDFTFLRQQIAILVPHGIRFSLAFLYAPAFADTPGWVFDPPYNVPLVHTDHPSVNQFPYYPDSTYITRRDLFRDAIFAEIASWDAATLALFDVLQSCEFTTGDEDQLKGNITSVTINGVAQPNPNAYYMTADEQNAYKRAIWSYFYVNLPAGKLGINSGYDGSNFQWLLDNISEAWTKEGRPTHSYSQNNEKNMAAWLAQFKLKPIGENHTFGEGEAIQGTLWWRDSPTRNQFMVLCSCLHIGVDIYNVSLNNILPDQWVYEFFNEYAGIRIPTDVGMCQLGGWIDYADTDKYSTGTYGNLIATGDLGSYTTAYDNIDALPITAEEKTYRHTNLLVVGKAGNTYINSARITAINAANPQARTATTLSMAQDHDVYNYDVGVNVIAGNYEKFVHQINPYTTSKEWWNIGLASTYHGRRCRSFDHANGMDEMFFDLSDLITSGSHSIQIQVWYYNNGGGQWALYYHNGTVKTKSGSTITNDAGSDWEMITFAIDDFNAGGLLPNSADFTLKYEGVADTKFDLIRIKIIGLLS